VEKASLLLRADANMRIGAGHLMRCLALAQAWQEAGGNAVFLMDKKTPALEARLQSDGMEIAYLTAQPGSADDAGQTVKLAREFGSQWVAVDGYHFDADYQKAIKEAEFKLLFIDDYGHADYYFADLVLNQNLHADATIYVRREPYTELLLGTSYVLLRREFLKWRGWERAISEIAHKVLVTLGGGDPDNITLKVIRALQHIEIDGLEVHVVIGETNPHYEILRAAVNDSQLPMHLERNVKDMPDLMAWADVAISAGGSTSWEMAFMGLPNIILILAENQRLTAELLDRRGASLNLGWHQEVSSTRIAEGLEELSMSSARRVAMSVRCVELVDGKGAERIVQKIRAD